MAKKEIAKAEIHLNGKKAETVLNSLKEQTKELKKQLKEAAKAGDTDKWNEINKKVKANESVIRSAKTATFDYAKVLKNINGASFTDLNKAMRTTRSELQRMKQTDPGYAKKEAQVKTLRTQITKLNNGVRTQPGLFKRAANGISNYAAMTMGAAASITGLIMAGRNAAEAANIREEKKDYLGALTGLDDASIDKLEANAKRASSSIIEGGVRIKQSADDIIDAYTLVGSQRPELLKNAEALHEVTQDAILLSEASKMQLEPAAKALTNTLNQFGLSADKSRKTINTLAAGSQVGAGNIEYLSVAIEKTGTTAKLMGMSVNTTVAAIESIAPNYSRAEMAGNSFDKVLLKMKASNIGYTSGVFDLNDGIDELRTMYANGTTSAEIFGVEHSKMGELLVLNQGKFNRFEITVSGTNKAVEQAIKNTSNHAAELAQARNEAHEYAVILGQKLQPAMTNIVSSGTMLLKLISGLITFFGKHGKAIIIVTSAIVGYTIAVKIAKRWDDIHYASLKAKTFITKAYTIITGVLTGKIKLATIAQRAWNIAQKSNPIGLLVGLIVAAGVAIFSYAKKMKGAADEQEGFNDELERTDKLLGKTQYQNFLTQIGFIKTALETLPDGSKAFITSIDKNVDVLSKFSNSLKDLRENELENYKQFFEEELVSLNRGMDGESNPLQQSLDKGQIEEYKKSLDLINKELKKYEEIRKKINESGGSSDPLRSIKYLNEEISALQKKQTELSNTSAVYAEYQKKIIALEKEKSAITGVDKKADAAAKKKKKELADEKKKAAELLQEYETYLEKRHRLQSEYEKKRTALIAAGGNAGNLAMLNDEEQKKLQEIDQLIWEKQESFKSWTNDVAEMSLIELGKTLDAAVKLLESHKSEGVSEEKLAAERAQIELLKSQIEALDGKSKVAKDTEKDWDDTLRHINDINQNINNIIDQFDNLNDSTKVVLSSAMNISAGAIGMITSIVALSTLSSAAITTTATTATAAIRAVETASIILAIIGAALQIAMAIAKVAQTLLNKDNNKQIEESAKKVADLENAYKNLERTVDNTFGTAKQGAIEQQKENLKLQQQAVQMQIDAEKSKKKPDEAAIAQWEQTLNDLDGQIEDMPSLADTLLGDDLMQAVDNFANAWVNAWRSGEDMILSQEKMVDDMIAGIITTLMSEQLQDAVAFLRETLATAWEDGRITDAERRRIEAARQALQDDSAAFTDNLESTGLLDGDSGISTNNSAKGFSTMKQETADELNGRFTALQASNEVIKIETIKFGDLMEDMKGLQLTIYSTIEDIKENTDYLPNMSDKLDKIEKHLKDT